MKLLRFKFIKGEYTNPIEGFEQVFHTSLDIGTTTPICLAGVNGSGKSKLLEVFTDVFYYLFNFYDADKKIVTKTKLQFEIEYTLETSNLQVKVSQISENGVPVFQIYTRGKYIEYKELSKVAHLLPRYVAGYTSGDNQTLSKRFEDNYLIYSEAVTDLSKAPQDGTKVPNSKLVFLDYKVNSFVFIANSIFRHNDQIKIINDKVSQLDSLESFRITIQEKPRYKNRLIPINLTPELSSYIGALKKCATCYYYEEDNNKNVLDFYLNKQSIALFKKYFKSPFELYSALYKLDLLNDVLLRRDKKNIIKNAEYANQKHLFPELSIEDKVFAIENIRINLKNVTDDVDYYDLSDGEHQLIHILGSILMIDEPDVLFLLDEPETHFNPQWRSKFISTLDSIEHTKKQDFFISTHSPFLLGDCKMEQVLIFKNGKAEKPKIQTYGLSMERLLKEAFGVIPPMSEKSLNDIKELQRSKSYQKIEDRIDDFGESLEKVYLFNRLSDLKSAKANEVKSLNSKRKK